MIAAAVAMAQGADESCCERPIITKNGQRGLVSVNSAHTLGAGRFTFGAYTDGSLDQSYLKMRETFTRIDSVFVPDAPKPGISAFNFQPFIGAGLAGFIDAGLMLPVHLDMLGKYQEAGVGDFRASLKLNARAAKSTPVFDLGLMGVLILPTGSKETGFFPRHLYYFNKDSLAATPPVASTIDFFSARKTAFETDLLLSLDLSALKFSIPLAFHVNTGMLFCTAPGNDNALLLAGGMELHALRTLALTAEFNSEMRVYNMTHGFKINQDILDITPALVLTPPLGFMLTAGCDFSLSAPSTAFTYTKPDVHSPQRITSGIEPRWRMFISIGWNGVLIDSDRDRDGILDRRDACVSVREDIDGYEDEDGCPDPDNDRDGVPDSLDKCPKEPEDMDGFEDSDGCPEYDNDNDRIPDSTDSCTGVAEDYDGFEDSDGCPDYDNDADMVPDSVDKCMNIPEDIDGFRDDDGCPDVDNDQDGVADSLDKCPDQIGPPSNAGCAKNETGEEKPKAREIKRGRVILLGVRFPAGSPAINPASYLVLDEVVASLVDWPQVMIEIQGHTDRTGTEEEKLRLSQERAEAVREYLINRGIAPHRLTAVGKGWSDPIADDRTAQGRSMNNRIELRRTDP
jgi:outer membrane protein OmpA-like peptidoglycan-associated protein